MMTNKGLTLESISKLFKEIEAQFPEPPKFRYGAEMSAETFEYLKDIFQMENVETLSINGLCVPSDLRGITIILVEGMPFGAVKEISSKNFFRNWR